MHTYARLVVAYLSIGSQFVECRKEPAARVVTIIASKPQPTLGLPDNIRIIVIEGVSGAIKTENEGTALVIWIRGRHIALCYTISEEAEL